MRSTQAELLRECAAIAGQGLLSKQNAYSAFLLPAGKVEAMQKRPWLMSLLFCSRRPVRSPELG